jgi:F-type H+-transporting ATPase subunit b
MKKTEYRSQNPKLRSQKSDNRQQITDNRYKKFLVFIGALSSVLCLLYSEAVFASGGGGQTVFTWRDWLWPVINFSILAVVLVWAGRKPAKEYFRKRTELIEKSLQEASDAKELARKTLEAVQDRLKNTDKELEDILEAARKSGEKEKEAIIAEGERLKEKIIEQAKANIDFELQKAKETIKSDAALMALELAEKEIKGKLGQKEQESLIDDYIKRLEAKN